MEELSPQVTLKTYNDIFENVAGQIRSTERPDSIIYVNVLEHIADDVNELNVINQTLDSGARLFHIRAGVELVARKL